MIKVFVDHFDYLHFSFIIIEYRTIMMTNTLQHHKINGLTAWNLKSIGFFTNYPRLNWLMEKRIVLIDDNDQLIKWVFRIALLNLWLIYVYLYMFMYTLNLNSDLSEQLSSASSGLILDVRLLRSERNAPMRVMALYDKGLWEGVKKFPLSLLNWFIFHHPFNK